MRPGLKAREGCVLDLTKGIINHSASMRPGLKAREGVLKGDGMGCRSRRFNEARA